MKKHLARGILPPCSGRHEQPLETSPPLCNDADRSRSAAHITARRALGHRSPTRIFSATAHTAVICFQAAGSFPTHGAGACSPANSLPLTDGRTSCAPNSLPAFNKYKFGAPNSLPAVNKYPFGATNSLPTVNKYAFGTPNSLPALDKYPFGATNSLPAPDKYPFGTPNSLPAVNKHEFGAQDSLPAFSKYEFGGQTASLRLAYRVFLRKTRAYMGRIPCPARTLPGNNRRIYGGKNQHTRSIV